MRKVGTETSKTYLDKLKSGFFGRYMSGIGAEMGYQGYTEGALPVLENCEGFDLTTPGYDGRKVPRPDCHYDYLYSSHTLEHISDYKSAICEWFRVVKRGGHIVTVVPHRDLYEKKLELPSRFNGDHRRFYTASSLLKEFEEALPINSYRVRHLRENDEGHVYSDPPEVHGRGLYELELVVQKL